MSESPHKARSKHVGPNVALAAAAVMAGAAALVTTPASALINPDFTPVQLVARADAIYSAALGPAAADGKTPLHVTEALKGKAPAKEPALDLAKALKPQAEALKRLLPAKGKAEALLVVGGFGEPGEEGAEPAEPAEPAAAGAEALLHVEGRWFRLFRKNAAGPWLLEGVDERMQGTWAGGTDMLARAVKYILADADASVPVRTGATWAQKVRVATLTGKAHGLLAVRLDDAPTSLPALHVLCEAGDRLIRWDARKQAFVDITADMKLTTKSQHAAWGDFDADGRCELACWDGRSLTVHGRDAGGTLGGATTSVRVPGDCIGLSVVGVGASGKAGILVGTRNIPLLAVGRAQAWAGEGFAATPIVAPPAGKSITAGLGRAHAPLVADLDGDGLPDVLQPFAKGSLLYAGTAPGAFKAARRSEALAAGEGTAGAFVGDFDADGLLDVFVAAEPRCFLWQNLGGGRFREALQMTGEAAYISKPDGIGGAACDVNNDGRQDVLILYAARPPQIFFNRGFRSFGHSHMLDLAERNLLPAAEKGQQAGLIADLDGDGAQDLAVVLANGELWVFFRDTEAAPALCVQAALPVGKAPAGPVAVTGWLGKRCLGAWNVTACSPGAMFGLYESGSLRLRWQLPGGPPVERKVAVQDKPVRFALTGEPTATGGPRSPRGPARRSR